MKRIKILRIIARLNIGGPAIHVILLTHGLDKIRFDSLLISGPTDKHEGDMSYYAQDKNVKPIVITELKRELNFLDDILAFIKIYRIINKEKPDIIHTHTAKAGTLGRLAGILYNLFNFIKGKRIKFIHTFHGHVFEGYFGSFKTRLFILIERFLALFTDRILTVSETLKKELVSLGICPCNKIEVIPLGFELDIFFKILPRNVTSLNIGIIGRLVPIKNHRLFLEAAKLFIQSGHQEKFKFKIIGDGELRSELEEYSRRLNISDFVEFLGWQKDLISVYSSLDIVALTSINEGTPVSLIEAMASGKVVVATDVGGVKDLLGEDSDSDVIDKSKEGFRVLKRGIIVRPQDSASFAAALNFILHNNALMREMGMRGRDFAKIKFTKERLIRDLEDLYVSLLNSSFKRPL